MPENRDFAWLRKTLCDEIEAVRNGTADHARAKSVAALAAAALKSVEVEAMVRQQQSDLAGIADVPALGSVMLCALEIPVFLAPRPAPNGQQLNEKNEPAQAPTTPAAIVEGERLNKAEHEITEVSGFKIGDRVECHNGHRGSIAKLTTSGRIEVKEDGGGTFPYSARHLKHEAVERPKITSPLVPPRFVAGRSGSGSA